MLVKAKPYFLGLWLLLLLLVLNWNQRGAVAVLIVMSLIAVGAHVWPKPQGLKTIYAEISSALPRSILFALLALIVWSALSVFWRYEALPAEGLALTLSLQTVALAFIVHHVRNTPQIVSGLLAVLLMAPVSWFLVHASWGNSLAEFHNALPTFYNRIFVTYNVISLPLTAFLWFQWGTTFRAKLLVLASGLLWLPSAMLTTSQTAQLVWIICWPLLCILLLLPRIAGKLVAYGLAILPLIFPGLIFLIERVLNFLSPYNFQLVNSSSSGLRLEIWKTTVNLIAERPILGWGINSYETTAPLAKSALIFPQVLERTFTHPHNAFLQIWLDLGLVGVVVLSALICCMARLIGKMAEELKPFATTALVAVSIVAAVSHGAWQGWWLSTLILMAASFAALDRLCPPQKR